MQINFKIIINIIETPSMLYPSRKLIVKNKIPFLYKDQFHRLKKGNNIVIKIVSR